MSRRPGAGAGVERLTETQRQCLRLTYQHMTSKEIAPLLGLSPHSVDAHLRIAMKVLGVHSRREAALAFHDFEAARPPRRRRLPIHYDAAEAPTHAHASETPASAWTCAEVGSNVALFREHPRNKYGMEKPVEQFGSTGAVFDLTSNERDSNRRFWSDPAAYSASKKVLIILVTALLSAMAFTTIVSGLAAMSLWVWGGDGTR